MRTSQLLSPRRVLRIVGAGLFCLSGARVCVLLIESYVQVRSERIEDEDLMRACDNGVAAQSADFRTLCLKKRAERSAPIVLKAVLRAVQTAFTDFCESMSSPTKIVMFVLFALTGIAAPVLKAVSQLVVESVRHRRKRFKSVEDVDSDSDDDEHVHEIRLLQSDVEATNTKQQGRVLRIAHGLRNRLAHRRADRVAPLATVEELPPNGWDDLFCASPEYLSGRPLPQSPTRLSRSVRVLT